MSLNKRMERSPFFKLYPECPDFSSTEEDFRRHPLGEERRKVKKDRRRREDPNTGEVSPGTSSVSTDEGRLETEGDQEN